MSKERQPRSSHKEKASTIREILRKNPGILELLHISLSNHAVGSLPNLIWDPWQITLTPLPREVNLSAVLSGAIREFWETSPKIGCSVKEKEIINCCRQLKEKGCDVDGVIEEICRHFLLRVPEDAQEREFWLKLKPPPPIEGQAEVTEEALPRPLVEPGEEKKRCLTSIETRVLQCFVEGLNTIETARRLGVSVPAVEKHKSRL